MNWLEKFMGKKRYPIINSAIFVTFNYRTLVSYFFEFHELQQKKIELINNRLVVQRLSVKKVFLEISQNSQKHLCQSLFFNKFFLLKNRLWHRCFPVNLVKFLRAPFYVNTSGGCFCLPYGSLKWFRKLLQTPLKKINKSTV